jgi:hypothetical protein
MERSYLEITYRKGRALAAYHCLPRRDGDRSARTEPVEGGLLVDYAEDGRPIGIEIPAPSAVDLGRMNDLLERLGQERARPEDLAPLVAA